MAKPSRHFPPPNCTEQQDTLAARNITVSRGPTHLINSVYREAAFIKLMLKT
jgi:hypothetical protein